MVDCRRISAADTDDVEGILSLCREAERFVASFDWCRRVRRMYFDRGFRYAAVFYCKLEARRNADPEVWVIVGDLPPAYLDTYCKNGAEALVLYCWWLDRWAMAVRNGESVEAFMPIVARSSYEPVTPSLECAEMMENRVAFIKRNLLQDAESEISQEFRREFGSTLRSE